MLASPVWQAELIEILGPDGAITARTQLRTYECDGLTGYRVVPALVALPRTAAEVAGTVRTCLRHGIPYVARGAGTGLSGGALPVADGIVISLQRMRRIIEVDPVNRRAVVEPGVTNLEISRAAAPYRLYYAPDPSSQQVCAIGGNVAENSGGPHCLKYGFTANHVLEAEVVLPDGSITRLGAAYLVQDGVVPRGTLAEVLGRIGRMAEQAGLRVANVFHAGDGNLHPLVLYSEARGEHERAEQLSTMIAELCVDMGGSLTGEHGIGTDKACSMPRMFSADDLATMQRLRGALDPAGLCNPGKIFPTPRLCGERPGRYRPHPLEAAGQIERL